MLNLSALYQQSPQACSTFATVSFEVSLPKTISDNIDGEVRLGRRHRQVLVEHGYGSPRSACRSHSHMGRRA